ncbi:MAG: helix-turn-helix transcriptional regulator [Micromonosporaceae bacterium]|nr:helix-turn-helix transcriptional regulator [Micromonosporaceae bacterium]
MHRVPAPPEVAEFVRWFWIPEWDIAPGRTSRQYLVAYPACNLVVEPEQVTLAGPTTRVSYRDLTGRGWGVGALLRPAAVPALAPGPVRLRDREVVVEAPELHAEVVAAMAIDDAEKRHAAAVEAYAAWLVRRVPPPTDRDRLANRMADLIDADSAVQSVTDAAGRLGVSPRTLQRLALQYVGLTPAEMIRRRRLQEAAQRVRSDPSANLAEIAAELGYADQAHLTNEFRHRLGFTPATYRGRVQEAPSPAAEVGGPPVGRAASGGPVVGGPVVATPNGPALRGPSARGRSVRSATRRSRVGAGGPVLARITAGRPGREATSEDG